MDNDTNALPSANNLVYGFERSVYFSWLHGLLTRHLHFGYKQLAEGLYVKSKNLQSSIQIPEPVPIEAGVITSVNGNEYSYSYDFHNLIEDRQERRFAKNIVAHIVLPKHYYSNRQSINNFTENK
jgi:hypothetical protein